MEALAVERRIFPPLAIGFAKSLDFPALSYTLLPLLLAVRYVNAPPDARTYGPSHWFLDYHHGFMRRGLVGQILSPLGFISWHTVFLIEAGVIACGIALTYLIFRGTLFGNLDERRLAAFLLAAPAFLPHMASMGGELDNFLFIVLLFACCFLSRLPNNLGLVLATLAVGVGLLIHEGFLFMFYPLVFIFILDQLHRRKITTVAVTLHCLAVALCFAAISGAGKFHGTESEWTAYAHQRTDMPFESAVFIPLVNTVSQQISFVRHCYTRAFISRIALTLVLSLPYAFALWHLLIAAVRRQRYAASLRVVIVGIFFVPLCLIPLGHDIMRWLSALCINMSLYILFSHQESAGNPFEREETATSLRRWAGSTTTVATFLYLVMLGPVDLGGTHLLTNIGSVLSGKTIH